MTARIAGIDKSEEITSLSTTKFFNSWLPGSCLRSYAWNIVYFFDSLYPNGYRSRITLHVALTYNLSKQIVQIYQ